MTLRQSLLCQLSGFFFCFFLMKQPNITQTVHIRKNHELKWKAGLALRDDLIPVYWSRWRVMHSRLTRGETHEYVSLKSEIGTHCSRLRSVFAPFFFPLSVTKGCLADRHLKQLQSIELPPGTNLTCFHFYLWQQYLVVSCTVTMLRLKLTEEVKELLVHSFCGKVGHLLGSRCVTSTVLSNRWLTVWKRC